MEASTITYSVSSCSDSLLEATKDFVIKLIIDEGGETIIRRIRLFRLVDDNGKISFERLVRLVASKVRQINNSNNNRHTHHLVDDNNVRLSYLDTDDDCIVVDSTEELMDALDQFADQRVLRLFVGEVTPAMRQVFLDSMAAFDGLDGGLNTSGEGGPGKKLLYGGMKEVIERQIDQVLEKRFRLLAEQRRRQEAGMDLEEVMDSQGHQDALYQHQSPFPPLSPQFPGKNGPSDSFQKKLQSPRQLQSPNKRSPYKPQQWITSPRISRKSSSQESFRASSMSASSFEPEVIGEEDYLPNEQDRPTAQYSIRLPWEAMEEEIRSSERRSSHQGNRNTNTRTHRDTNAGYNRLETAQNDLYDLSMQQQDLTHKKSPSNLKSPSSSSDIGFGDLATGGVRRINIRRDPTPTPTARFYDDGSRRLDDNNEDKYDSTPNSSPGHRPQRFHPDSNSQYDEQDWDNNLVDSDEELSILLSDADFSNVETRDDTVRGTSVGSSRAANDKREQPYDDERAISGSPKPTASQPHTQLSSDNNGRQQPPNNSNTNNTAAKQNANTSRSTSDVLALGQVKPSITIATSPIKGQIDTTKNNEKPNSNQKPPAGASRSNKSQFSHVPRPMPPATKKNKLLGILYNSNQS